MVETGADIFNNGNHAEIEIPMEKREEILNNVGVSYALTPPAINWLVGFPVKKMAEILKSLHREKMPVEYPIGFGSKDTDEKFYKLYEEGKITPYSFHSYKLPTAANGDLTGRALDVVYQRPKHRLAFKELAEMILKFGAKVGVVHMAEVVDVVITEDSQDIFKYLEQLQYGEDGQKMFDFCLETSGEYATVWEKMRSSAGKTKKYADLIYATRSPLLLAEKIKKDKLDLKLTIDLQHWITDCLGRTPTKTSLDRFKQFKREWEELVAIAGPDINELVGHVHINSAAAADWQKDAHEPLVATAEVKFFLRELARLGYGGKTIIELKPLGTRNMIWINSLDNETKALNQSIRAIEESLEIKRGRLAKT